ncbi:YwqG family protein [Phenylobacterium aquaticum]|uniref:YwqG family protein n=1 Tax=Phenylobacterium aquaticum TaxID=1763816 RepID=UPI0026EAAF97|nr:YwqG family protein [Phenylobacterium aquaticum]
MVAWLAFLTVMAAMAGLAVYYQIRALRMDTVETPQLATRTANFRRRMTRATAPALVLIEADTPGFSKIGGAPDWRSGSSWPQGPEGRLGFLLQLDLAAAHDAGGPDWLPTTGGLYVFRDDRWGLADQVLVLHQPLEELETAVPPGDLRAKWRHPERRIGFMRRMSRPSLEWLGGDIREVDADAFDRFDLTEGDGPSHQVGGYPAEIQETCMPLECEYARRKLPYDPGTATPAITKAARAWRLLVQIDSDRALKMNWGDGGMIYVLIREADARAGDFSKTVTITQTY